MKIEKIASYTSVEIGSIPFLLGQYDPMNMAGFDTILSDYADKPMMRLQHAAYEAFLKMAAAAENDGHTLCILSATRSFDYQKTIWENKWTGNYPIDGGINACETYPDGYTRAIKIMEYSAMPGTSRHHWGTDIDLNALDNAAFEKEFKPLYQWLKKNANRFGFFQPYSTKGPQRPFGYNEEKWHWTYLPLSQHYTRYIADHLIDNQVSGFMGDEYCDQIDIVDHYILGIDPSCK